MQEVSEADRSFFSFGSVLWCAATRGRGGKKTVDVRKKGEQRRARVVHAHILPSDTVRWPRLCP